jgi:hypothetical protein
MTFLSGQIPWNKGKTFPNNWNVGRKHSKETREKLSKKRKEFFANGGTHPRGMLGKPGWNKSDKKWECKDCGKKIWHGRTRCKKCARIGSLNPKWKNGVSFADAKQRTSDQYLKWKQSVLAKFGKSCFYCGSKDGLHCHHIVHWSTDKGRRFDVNNGIVLCAEHHRKIHRKDTAMSNDISGLSLVELESLAYRQIVILEQTQQNLQILEQKIAEKQNEKPVDTVNANL